MVKLHLIPRGSGRDVISAVAFICYRCFIILKKPEQQLQFKAFLKNNFKTKKEPLIHKGSALLVVATTFSDTS
ncbi:hypothetical protein LMB24_00455, partial [Limosilactobacillus reuteri]|uniref:hypothetical protein n=1 Tax=Limosilactobacillus reuteri TaxID=1598 RepID=UPI001E602931